VPFLRVVRDKRGYETTYLMHWYREGARQRSRILYMFRTPGGVRVGRDPFDSQVRREIEAQYPDITFEWDIVRENQQIVEPAEQQRRRRPTREGEESARPPAPVVAAAPVAQTAAPPRPPIPSVIEGTTADEQIAFLVSWYPLVRERIQLRTSDPARLETLLAMAERLNPTDWTDADHIASGLQQAAEALERLSHLLARRRRRSRRKGAHPADGTTPVEEVRAGDEATGADEEAVGDEMPDAMDAADAADSSDDIDPSEPPES
jgi:hypothetical protein